MRNGLNIHFPDEIRNQVLAGTILVIATAQACGALNVEFMRGVVALAQFTVIGYGCSWPTFLQDARAALGADLGGMLDTANVPVIGE